MATDPPKSPQRRKALRAADAADPPDDTQPISRIALEQVEAEADTYDTADTTDTMHRASLPFDTAASSPDTEPSLRAAVRIDLEIRGSASTIAPVAASYGIEDVRKQFDRGDFDAALALAEAIVAYDAHHKEARSYAASCELRLRRRYAARLGSMRSVPRRTTGDAAGVDDRARALLARVDGRATTEEILRASGLAEMDALRLFVSLLDHALVTLA